jgi:hypothetical protein
MDLLIIWFIHRFTILWFIDLPMDAAGCQREVAASWRQSAQVAARRRVDSTVEWSRCGR